MKKLLLIASLFTFAFNSDANFFGRAKELALKALKEHGSQIGTAVGAIIGGTAGNVAGNALQNTLNNAGSGDNGGSSNNQQHAQIASDIIAVCDELEGAEAKDICPTYKSKSPEVGAIIELACSKNNPKSEIATVVKYVSANSSTAPTVAAAITKLAEALKNKGQGKAAKNLDTLLVELKKIKVEESKPAAKSSDKSGKKSGKHSKNSVSNDNSGSSSDDDSDNDSKKDKKEERGKEDKKEGKKENKREEGGKKQKHGKKGRQSDAGDDSGSSDDSGN